MHISCGLWLTLASKNINQQRRTLGRLGKTTFFDMNAYLFGIRIFHCRCARLYVRFLPMKATWSYVTLLLFAVILWVDTAPALEVEVFLSKSPESQTNYISGAMEMLSLLYAINQEPEKARIINAAYFERSGTNRDFVPLRDLTVLEECKKVPQGPKKYHIEGVLFGLADKLLKQYACASEVIAPAPASYQLSVTNQLVTYTLDEFFRSVKEQDDYAQGAAGLLVYFYGVNNDIEKARTLYNWYFKQTNAPDGSAILPPGPGQVAGELARAHASGSRLSADEIILGLAQNELGRHSLGLRPLNAVDPVPLALDSKSMEALTVGGFFRLTGDQQGQWIESAVDQSINSLRASGPTSPGNFRLALALQLFASRIPDSPQPMDKLMALTVHTGQTSPTQSMLSVLASASVSASGYQAVDRLRYSIPLDEKSLRIVRPHNEPLRTVEWFFSNDESSSGHLDYILDSIVANVISHYQGVGNREVVDFFQTKPDGAPAPPGIVAFVNELFIAEQIAPQASLQQVMIITLWKNGKLPEPDYSRLSLTKKINPGEVARAWIREKRFGWTEADDELVDESGFKKVNEPYKQNMIVLMDILQRAIVVNGKRVFKSEH